MPSFKNVDQSKYSSTLPVLPEHLDKIMGEKNDIVIANIYWTHLMC